MLSSLHLLVERIYYFDRVQGIKVDANAQICTVSVLSITHPASGFTYSGFSSQITDASRLGVQRTNVKPVHRVLQRVGAAAVGLAGNLAVNFIPFFIHSGYSWDSSGQIHCGGV